MHLGSDEAKERSIRGQFFQTLEADVVILMDMDRKQSPASITWEVDPGCGLPWCRGIPFFLPVSRNHRLVLLRASKITGTKPNVLSNLR